MKFIFPIIAILICLVASYFTLSMSEGFEKIQADRQSAISTNKTVTGTADALDAENEKLQADLDAAADKLELAVQTNSALESSGNVLKSDVAKLDSELTTQDSELAELEKTMEELRIIFEGLDVTIDNVGEKVAEIDEGLKAKRVEAEELDTLIEGARTSLGTKQEEVQRLAERKEERNERIARNAMEARVTAVNQDWGFLVIGAGSNSGFTPQTSLLVTRDGRLLGRVNPSAIEPNQTIAEIDMKSLSSGVRIQPGDKVILAKPAFN